MLGCPAATGRAASTRAPALVAGAGLTPGSKPVEITTGPDGNLWFTEFTANSIARIEPRNHAITEYRTLTPLR